MNFSRTLLGGLDWQVLILMILFFTVFNIAIGDTVISALIIYSMEKILTWVRGSIGERILSRNKLVDEKFLL
jgi:hypothetical protein